MKGFEITISSHILKCAFDKRNVHIIASSNQGVSDLHVDGINLNGQFVCWYNGQLSDNENVNIKVVDLTPEECTEPTIYANAELGEKEILERMEFIKDLLKINGYEI